GNGREKGIRVAGVCAARGAGGGAIARAKGTAANRRRSTAHACYRRRRCVGRRQRRTGVTHSLTAQAQCRRVRRRCSCHCRCRLGGMAEENGERWPDSSGRVG
ncbi:unnamed protein product, partial [Phaeothamnion confervicola]